MINNNRMIFSGEKETFILRVLMKKVQEAGVDCEFVPCIIDELNNKFKGTSLIAIYLEEGIRIKEEVLHFIEDYLEEKDGHIILIGEQKDIAYFKKQIPDKLVYKAFVRPVDNAEYVNTVEEYFKEANSGQLKKRILIVDDDASYLNMVRLWLKDTYKISMANSGLQAIKYLSLNTVDLILLDYEMPITSGPQVLEMLRADKDTKSIPVIFLTGKGDKDSVMSVVALRPEGYFLKNIQKYELLEKLKEFFILH